MKKMAIILGGLALIGAGCASTTAVDLESIGASRFGQVVETTADLQPLEGGWVRLDPGPFWWDQIETSQDVYDWSKADEAVRAAQSQNQALLVTLWPFAQWDQERCHQKESKTPEGVWLRGVCHNDSFQEWVTRVVERYDGDGVDDMPDLKYPITHWEIMSEPDSDPEQQLVFQSGPDAYAEIYRLAHTSIKAAQPNAVVVFGGMTNLSARSKAFWKLVLETERARANIFAIHSRALSDQFFAKEYHEYLDSISLYQQPFWITDAEVGSWLVEWDEETKAQMTFVGYVEAFANGAEKVFARDDQKQIETIVEVLDGFTEVKWMEQGKSLVKFTFADRVVYAIWDGVSLPAEVTGMVETITYTGKRARMEAAQVQTDEPVFVIVTN